MNLRIIIAFCLNLLAIESLFAEQRYYRYTGYIVDHPTDRCRIEKQCFTFQIENIMSIFSPPSLITIDFDERTQITDKKVYMLPSNLKSLKKGTRIKLVASYLSRQHLYAEKIQLNANK